VKQETVDRLSPLTSTMTLSSQFVMQPTDAEFEKFTVDLDVDSSCLEQHQSDNNASSISAESHLMVSAANNGNIRRHTVGPGDVAHEQALNNPATAINFKFDGTAMMMGPNQIPINLPMLLNQPINTFTIKDQHLLKPPMEMGASEFNTNLNYLYIKFLTTIFNINF
jgi:serine/threonine-protein kinase SIK3